MLPLIGTIVNIVLCLNYIVCGVAVNQHHQYQYYHQAITKPHLVLLEKLITGQPTPVDRRKAVTIGFNRWLRPLTFQVPDVISNLIPTSSNIIKVHEDPKNKTKLILSNGVDQLKSFNQQPPLMAYNPLHLITNFDQNPFLKSLPVNSPIGAFAYPNSSFAFDESQLSSVQAPLFALQHPQQFGGGQFGFQMNNKPYQLQPKQQVPLFDTDGSYSHYGLHNQETFQNSPMLYTPFYPSHNDENIDTDHHPNSNQRYPIPSSSQQNVNKNVNFFSGPQQMSESYQNKNFFPNVQSNYQDDYYPKEPHQRLPPSGSGNYDYSREFSDQSTNPFSSITDHTFEKTQKFNFPFKKQSYTLSNQEQSSVVNQIRPFYGSQTNENNNIANSEKEYFRDYDSQGNRGPFMNESEFSMEHNSLDNSFFKHQAAQHDIIPKSENIIITGQKSEYRPRQVFDRVSNQSNQEAASYSGRYFESGFQTAVASSMLKPVIVAESKNEEPSDQTSNISQDRSTIIDKTESMISATATTNGRVNVSPSIHHRANLPSPVANRIKEFFKGMKSQPEKLS